MRYNPIVHSWGKARSTDSQLIMRAVGKQPRPQVELPGESQGAGLKARWGLHPRAASCAGGGVKQAQ